MSLLQKKIRVWPFVLILLLGTAGGAYAFYQRHPYIEHAVYDFPLVQEGQEVAEAITEATTSEPTVEEFVEEEGAPDTPAAPAAAETVDAQSPLPESIRIEVPFMSQAPHGNWDMPYQEACEEASLILVHHYLQSQPITADQMDAEILDMVKIQNEEFGYSADITMAELAEVARQKYGYSAELFEDFMVDDMKRLLAQGHPIIVPLAGRRLGNPYYSGEGPWYHVLVITGYDSKNFITNDVGTRHGAGYKYPYERIYQNIHDWNMAKEDIENGKRVMLVVKKK